MIVAAYCNQYGPAEVWTLPEHGEPEHACIPQGPFPRARSQFSAKGSGLSWLQWGQALASSLPYFDSWSVEQVPDGISPQQALHMIRFRSSQRVFPHHGIDPAPPRFT